MTSSWAQRLGAQTPMLGNALAAYRELKKRGYSELDSSVVVKLYSK